VFGSVVRRWFGVWNDVRQRAVRPTNIYDVTIIAADVVHRRQSVRRRKRALIAAHDRRMLVEQRDHLGHTLTTLHLILTQTVEQAPVALVTLLTQASLTTACTDPRLLLLAPFL